MKLAILHHHLNRGGVTQVVMHQLRSLLTLAESDRPERIAMLHGGRADGWDLSDDESRRLGLKQIVVEGLDYDEGGRTPDGPRQLASDLRQALHEGGFSATDTVLHVHNHSLGKNLSLPGALIALAEDGYRELLQIHDFAEDFRPANYARLARGLRDAPLGFPATLYPQARTLHYAVLTARDQKLLSAAGVAADRLHWLPNAVLSPGELPDRRAARAKLTAELGIPADRHLLVYPVRGIRRKNVGEAVLWSALCQDFATVVITLAPKNPLEQGSFELFRHAAQRWGLPMHFGTAATAGLSYLEMLAASDTILTTSVAEGFGMVFLESCLIERPLVGRDLPEVTADFARHGIELPGLEPRLVIPWSWVGRERYREMTTRRFQATAARYGYGPAATRLLEEALDELTSSDGIDFARLDLQMQVATIGRIAQDAEDRRIVNDLNPWLRASLLPSATRAELEACLTSNRSLVACEYSLVRNGERLQAIYQQLISASPTPVTPPTNAGQILTTLLDIRRFHPLRVEQRAHDPIAHTFACLSRPLRPLPTGATVRLQPLQNIRAVLFDVYGTIMISGSGEVGTVADGGFATAWADAFQAMDLPMPIPPAEGVERLHGVIRAEQARLRREGTEYPEIDIVEVWRRLLADLGVTLGSSTPDEAGRAADEDACLQRLAAEYEARANPVWPMPGLGETLAYLRESGRQLGIISNAQFFTPRLFPALLSATLEDLGVAPTWQFYSYRCQRAKPGMALYEQAVSSLAAVDIFPSETLYVGNDLLNDVLPADNCGLRTALFAGDKRSLRLRAGDERVASVAADLVIVDLRQLIDCLPTPRVD